MALKFFGNVNKAEADLDSTDKLVQSDCEKAGVKSAMRDGKVIPLAEATTSEKYAALRAAQPAGDDLESRAQLVQRNGIIAAELESTNTKLVASQALVSSLNQEVAKQTSRIETLESANATLTSEKSSQIELRNSSVTENANLLKKISATTAALAKTCIEFDCMEFNGTDGKALGKDASDSDLSKSAANFSHNDMLSAIKGSINSNMAKLGIQAANLPAGGLPPQTKPKSELKGYDRTRAAMEEQALRLLGTK